MKDENFEKKTYDKNKKFTLIKGISIGVVTVLLVQLVLSGVSSVFGIGFGNNVDMDKKINEIYGKLDKYYANDYDKEKTQDGIYAGLVYGVDDPYTTYMNKETLSKFMEQTNGKYAGLGVVVSPNPDKADNTILVVTPYEGAPGFKAGMRAGDKILKVNGIAVFGDSLDEAVTMMKGKEGTSVNVTYWSKSTNKEVTTDIVREEVNVPTISHKMMANNVGYIKISNFENVTLDQFNNAYDKLTEQKMQGLVIDVRNNPGGLLDVVCKIADRLVPEGYITYTEDKYGKKDYKYSDANQVEVPLVMLVNGNSASASEVLSGAVKDFKVGELVGTQTFGKGVVQNLYPLSDGSAIKITMAKYYTPSGVCIHGVGIAPNYEVEQDPIYLVDPEYKEENDLQLQKGLEVIASKLNK